MAGWFVYMVRCADGSIYTGSTTDVARRIDEHNRKPTAAAYTRARRPVVLVYTEACPSRSAAVRRELEIKDMEKEAKEILAGLVTPVRDP
jgi:putative endonuclease